uniref:Uncharacterized protein n=1 Tax=Rhizophora mucronata TaxID=61149 RepID=A0A2P2QZL4_RHIMU
MAASYLYTLFGWYMVCGWVLPKYSLD